MKCKYCKRKLPNNKYKTKNGKCIWCDADYFIKQTKEKNNE